MYLTGSVGAASRPYLDAHLIGFITTPNIGNVIEDGWVWAADNGCFSSAWDEGKWLRWLDSGLPLETCLFATVPDVVGDHKATLERWARYAPEVERRGFPLAFVAQDGATVSTVPWGQLHVLFIGGTNQFKLGREAKELIREAKRLGKWVHVGRVNSQGRFLAFAALGADSADGTYLAFGPDTNMPKLLAWIRHHETQPPLFKED